MPAPGEVRVSITCVTRIKTRASPIRAQVRAMLARARFASRRVEERCNESHAAARRACGQPVTIDGRAAEVHARFPHTKGARALERGGSLARAIVFIPLSPARSSARTATSWCETAFHRHRSLDRADQARFRSRAGGPSCRDNDDGALLLAFDRGSVDRCVVQDTGVAHAARDRAQHRVRCWLLRGDDRAEKKKRGAQRGAKCCERNCRQNVTTERGHCRRLKLYVGLLPKRLAVVRESTSEQDTRDDGSPREVPRGGEERGRASECPAWRRSSSHGRSLHPDSERRRRSRRW